MFDADIPFSVVFRVQLFEQPTNRRTVIGARLSVETAEEAFYLAHSAGRTSSGAAALCLTVDEDGKTVTTILAKVGAVP